jgi:Trk K+ transport system NAD-binding subunit
MLGAPGELVDADLAASAAADGAAPVSRAGPITVARWAFSEIPASLRLVFAGIVALVAVSTVVIHLGYRRPDGHLLDTLDSLYFTVETISTVGFGDFTFSSQADWLRVFGIALIILGAASVTTLFALITSTLFSRSIANAFGQQRITRMHGHVVIVGLGAVGVGVMEGLLDRGRPVVVIERDEHNRHLARARALGVPVLTGDATEPSTLDDANARSASAIAALTSSDLTNLETGLVLREYLAGSTDGVVPIVLRVFDRGLSQSVEQNFSFPAVRSTSALAAPWFVGAALGLGILSTFYVEQQLFLVARLAVGAEGGLVGLAMTDLGARIRVIALGRGPALQHPVRRDARFAPGDRAYLIGPHEELLAVLRRDAAAAVDLA